MNRLYNNKYDILASTIQPNPISAKYWADLSSNPHGGDLKYFNGEKWVLVNDKATTDIAELEQDVEALETAMSNKVDKVEGKQLSTEDYTTAEKEKLASLNNYDDSTIVASITALQSGKVDKDGSKVLSDNNYTTEEKTKLAGLSNYSDTEVRELITALTTRVSTLETNYTLLEERVSALETPSA